MEIIRLDEEFNGRIVNAELRPILEKGYFISEYCTVYTNKRGTFKKLAKKKDNLITFKVNKKNLVAKWDKLALKTFKPLEKELKYIRYIDGNPKNTHYTNMEWSDSRPPYTNEQNKIMKIHEVVSVNREEVIKEVEIRYFGYDGYYISEYSNPYSLKGRKLKPLKIYKRKSGHDSIRIRINNKITSIDINIAVAKAFIPIEKELPFVLFRDQDVLNKHYSNLYWNKTCDPPDDDFHPLPIPGFSKYKFNKIGKCKSYQGKYPKFLKPGRDEEGYFFYSLVNDEGESKALKRHRIIAMIFIPNPENKPEVDHLNRKRGDDRVENLEWKTSAENSSNKDFEAISEKISRLIGKFDKEGNLIEEYKNAHEAAADIDSGDDFIGIPRSLRDCASKNKNIVDNFHTCYGFVWKYMTEKKKYELLPGEKLIPIKNDEFESDCFITTFFNIISKTGYKMILYINGGYPQCSIKINGKNKSRRIHRLVAIFFVAGRTAEKKIVHHKDENKMNYHPSNLEWVTSSENSYYSSHKRTKAVDQFDKQTGKFIKRYNSKKEAAKSLEYGLPKSIATACYRKESVYGFSWRYADFSVPVPPDIEVNKTNRKSVDQFTLEGKFVKRYESISDIIKEADFGASVGECCRGVLKTACGYIWRFADIDKSPSDIEIEEKDEGQYPKKAVIQSTYKGVFIKKYDNIFIAAEENKLTPKRINEGCIGKFKSVGNSTWKYEDIDEKDEDKYPKKAVIQSSRSGVFIKRYDNIFIAAQESKLTPKRINEGCIGKFKSVGYSGWKYE